MTSGALLFAFNNSDIDYVSLARWTAKNIKRHLNIPTALVTDQLDTYPEFAHHILIEKPKNSDLRYFGDFDRLVPWHNRSRTQAYKLTPWTQTLVLDVDYVVASDNLKSVLNSTENFLAHNSAFDLTGLNDFANLNTFGTYKMPMSWATVMMFRQSTEAELIFKMMSMVKDNYEHYTKLYSVSQDTYRNDYALSIALNTLNGHDINYHSIAWPLASLTPEHVVKQLAQDDYRIEFKTPEGKLQYIKISKQDFHAMGKQQLGDIVANSI